MLASLVMADLVGKAVVCGGRVHKPYDVISLFNRSLHPAKTDLFPFVVTMPKQ